jgi:hypothetical protein
MEEARRQSYDPGCQAQSSAFAGLITLDRMLAEEQFWMRKCSSEDGVCVSLVGYEQGRRDEGRRSNAQVCGVLSYCVLTSLMQGISSRGQSECGINWLKNERAGLCAVTHATFRGDLAWPNKAETPVNAIKWNDGQALAQ